MPRSSRPFSVATHVIVAVVLGYGLVLCLFLFELLGEQTVPTPVLAGFLLVGFTLCAVGLLFALLVMLVQIMTHWPASSWHEGARAAAAPPPAPPRHPPFPQAAALLDRGADTIKDTLLDFEIGAAEDQEKEEVVRIPVVQPNHGAWADRYRKMHEHELRSW